MSTAIIILCVLVIMIMAGVIVYTQLYPVCPAPIVCPTPASYGECIINFCPSSRAVMNFDGKPLEMTYYTTESGLSIVDDTPANLARFIGDGWIVDTPGLPENSKRFMCSANSYLAVDRSGPQPIAYCYKNPPRPVCIKEETKNVNYKP
jgi:hypothetical protein